MAFPDDIDPPAPSALKSLLEPFTVEDITETQFGDSSGPNGTLLSGTLKSLREDPLDIGIGELHLPGITDGLPFRYARFESPAVRWHFDFVVDELSLKLKGVHAADFVKESGTTPRRLIRRKKDTAVVIRGEAAVRVGSASAGAPVIVQLIDKQNAANPVAETGGVTRLSCEPPHFLIGESEFGLTVKDLLYDFSDTYSPTFITNLGHGPEWTGFAIAEAAFYTPGNALGTGGFSASVRNLLLGAPRGVQGELEVQWGRTPLDAATFQFRIGKNGPIIGSTADGDDSTGSGRSRVVRFSGNTGSTISVLAGFVATGPAEPGAPVEDWDAIWAWPDGTTEVGDAAGGVEGHQIRDGEKLVVTPRERLSDGRTLTHPPIEFLFVAAGGLPKVNVVVRAGAGVDFPTASSAALADVLHVSGPAAEIADRLGFLAVQASPSGTSTSTFTWQLGESAEPTDATGDPFTLPVSALDSDRHLILREKEEGADDRIRTTRVRIQLREGEPLWIGARDGVFAADDASHAAMQPSVVVQTLDLYAFRSRGLWRQGEAGTASIDASAPAGVAIPGGAIAEVSFGSDETASGGAPADVRHDRHVQILFEFATGTTLGWGRERPVGASAAGSRNDLVRQLQAWAANYPGAHFLVIGRCDDLGPGSAAENDAYNDNLARTRAASAVGLLTESLSGSGLTPVSASDITSWAERENVPSGTDTGGLLESDEAGAGDRLIRLRNPDWNTWPPRRNTAGSEENIRREYRRADIYAVGGMPGVGAEREELAPARAPDTRRMWIPGEGIDPVPAPESTPDMDYRVKLLVGWDRPLGRGWDDLIPSKAEFEFAWRPDNAPLPPLAGEEVTIGREAQDREAQDREAQDREVLTVYGHWAYDEQTEFTRMGLGIRSDGDPDGLVKTTDSSLVAALALGPVLLSGVDSSTDTFEKGARLAAMAAAAAFAHVKLGGDDPLIGTDSSAVLKSLEAQAEIGKPGGDATEDDWRVALIASYTTRLHVNTGQLGLRTEPDHPVAFRYNKVGIRFDHSKSDFWDQLTIAYPTDALQIEDPGKWQIDGVLGKLLRAIEAATGVGSLWFETRFAFALSIGVVEISEAAIRVTFDDTGSSDFSLRGLVARIDVPNTVKGEGRLRIEDGGTIKAGVDLEITPLQLKASAAFAMRQETTPTPYTFVNLFAKVQFPAGIPLGSSGAAIHGFVGQTVINGTRDVAASSDVVKREIGWWGKRPEDKYRALKDQHALGLGAVVGTLPDASFSLSVQGMIVVAFPAPEVIFGVEVSLLSVPDRGAKEQGGSSDANIVGLVVIDDKAVSLAASARYTIPKLLEVKAPFAARFPYTGSGTYVRLGSDGQAELGRSGEPVTLTLLPGTLNLKAFSYLMIEQDGLPSLGGRPDFSFEGFSVGFGAGASLDWRAGPLRLSASALLLAGIGTDPLFIKAGIFVKGELDLVVVSVGADGSITLSYRDERVWLDGKFCGRVKLLFWTVRGCVDFHIGSPAAASIAAPPAPVASVALVDRNGAVMGEAAPAGTALAAKPIFALTEDAGQLQNTGADPADNHTVWADTAPVINFRHFVQNAVPPGQFDLGGQPSGESWFGSVRLKYRYRLDDVRLLDADGNLVRGKNGKPLLSAWVPSPMRQPTGEPDPRRTPSGAETQSLKLLDWVPWVWALPMADGGASVAGDPARTVANLCEPLPEVVRLCLHGADARYAGPERIRLLPETPPGAPYTSRFMLAGAPGARASGRVLSTDELMAAAAAMGALLAPGAVVDLPIPVQETGATLARGYRLPEMQLASSTALASSALPWHADLDRPVTNATLFLLVCDGLTLVNEPRPEKEVCVDFSGIKPGQYPALSLPGMVLTTRVSGRTLYIVDLLTDTSPVRTIPDGKSELLMLSTGVLVKLDHAATRVRLFIATPGGEKTGASAYDAAGNIVDTAMGNGVQGALEVLELNGAGIVAVTVDSGGEACLTRICTSQAEDGKRESLEEAQRWPVVRSFGTLRHGGDWTPKLLRAIPDGNHDCWLLAYTQPAALAEAREFDILAPTGSRVTLIAFCGTDTITVQRRKADEGARKALQEDVATAAGAATPAVCRELLLQPGAEYRIEVDWSWRAWESNEDGTNQPGPDDFTVDWTKGNPQAFHFRIAAEELGATDTQEPGATDTQEPGATDTQDGLNEYCFDPRDIARYLDHTEPADGRDTVFTEDPLWAHFTAGHVENLVDLYGRELVLEVVRTDPPPQPSPALLAGAMLVPQFETMWVWAPAGTQSVAERRINAALQDAPCLPDGPAVGGASLGGRFRLEPNAMYDFNLLARSKSDPTNAVTVNATRFRTSRYRNPLEMLRALGFDIAQAHPIAPTEIILAAGASLPGGPLLVSDLDLAQALDAIGAGTLPLPDEEPRCVLLWQASGAAFRVVGVLIDACEPLRREASVLDGQQLVQSIRCEPVRLSIGTAELLPVRATNNWTRVLFVAPAPITVAEGDELVLELETTPEGLYRGRRSLQPDPVMLETEGF